MKGQRARRVFSVVDWIALIGLTLALVILMNGCGGNPPTRYAVCVVDSKDKLHQFNDAKFYAKGRAALFVYRAGESLFGNTETICAFNANEWKQVWVEPIPQAKEVRK